jgi:single-stranded-DNA-specific exonuclease
MLPIHLEEFKNRFEKVVASTISPEMLIPVLEIDLKIGLNQITPKFYRILSQIAPFGPDNMRPVFASEQVIPENVQLLKEKHLKFRVKSPTGNAIFEVIAFSMPHFYQPLLDAKSINLCYTIEENFFQGKSHLQLRVKDILF